MKKYVLAIDAGTSSVKVGLLDENLNEVARSRESYQYRAVKDRGVEMDFETLWKGLVRAVNNLEKPSGTIESIGLSVLCPGLTPMDSRGIPLHPSIIHLDRRSPGEARWALARVGEKRFLETAGNLPYPGGVSLTSILWLKKHHPDVYSRAYVFGHTNTFLVKRLTDVWGIDPTNASFTGLYDTVHFSDWDREIVEKLEIDYSKLPRVLPSAKVAGKLTGHSARTLGLKEGTPVVMGAGDTACAVLGAGAVQPGQVLHSTGTVEVIALCAGKPHTHPKQLIRTHAIPGRWIIMIIVGAGGESLRWFYRQFCREMTENEFFGNYLPKVLSEVSPTMVTFRPYLAGDRVSFEQKSGGFSGMDLGTNREDMLRALISGITTPMVRGFKRFEKLEKLNKMVFYTGGGALDEFSKYKSKLFKGFQLHVVENCASRGAGMLAWMGLGLLENGAITSQ